MCFARSSTSTTDFVRLCRERVEQDPQDAMWQARLALNLRLRANYLTAFVLQNSAGNLDGKQKSCMAEFMLDSRRLRLKEARQAAAEAVDIMDRLVRLDPDHKHWAESFSLCCQQLSTNQRLLGDAKAARETMLRGQRQLVAFHRRRLARDPSHAEWQAGIGVQSQSTGQRVVHGGRHERGREAVSRSRRNHAAFGRRRTRQRHVSQSLGRLRLVPRQQHGDNRSGWGKGSAPNQPGKFRAIPDALSKTSPRHGTFEGLHRGVRIAGDGVSARGPSGRGRQNPSPAPANRTSVCSKKNAGRSSKT